MCPLSHSAPLSFLFFVYGICIIVIQYYSTTLRVYLLYCTVHTRSSCTTFSGKRENEDTVTRQVCLQPVTRAFFEHVHSIALHTVELLPSYCMYCSLYILPSKVVYW